MKEFFKVLKRYIPPYKKMLLFSLIFTFISAILNVFSFMIIIPILQILFKITDTSGIQFIPWSEMNSENIKDVAINNANYYLNGFIESYGASMTLMLLGIFLIVMTLLKTASYFGSSASIIPLRTGIVRDIRTQLYNKVPQHPKQRKAFRKFLPKTCMHRQGLSLF